MTKEQWQAIKNHDKNYDGQFVYVHRNTGIICKPSCEKKEDSPQNVIIYDSVQEALAAGYHVCRKCRPDVENWKGAKQELTEEAQRYIHENYTRDFSLQELADYLHINKFHMLRTFKTVTGVTPLQYHNQYRCEKAQELLQNPQLAISYIAIETGFNSASHFSRVFHNITGMTPSNYRKRYFRSLDE